LKTSPGAISAGDPSPVGVNADFIIIYAITLSRHSCTKSIVISGA
jgi:hypothetical protein